jgi:MFS family permease
LVTAGIVSFNTISEILTEPPYDWSTSSTGLVFLAALVGNFVGWLTGVLSDRIVIHLARKNRGIKEPEMRLWTLCFSFVYAAVGYFMYGFGAQAGAHWMTIAFGVGCMIAHQVSACSIATTYAMECFPGIGGELVVVLAICSSCINFAISYSVQPFIEAAGYGYAFLFFGLCVLCSMLAAIPMGIYGKSWRRRCSPKWRGWLSQREN